METILNKQTRDDLIQRTKSINGDEQPLWGKMNVQQMLCHSADQIRMSIGLLKTKYLGNFLTTTVLKKLVLWGMPIRKGKVETVKELKHGIGGTKPTSLDVDKESLIKLITEFDEMFDKDKLVCHPVLGDMNKNEWGILVFIHADYHLKQFGK